MSDHKPWKKWLKRLLWIIPLTALLAGGAWAWRVMNSFTGKGSSISDVWQGITNPRGLFPNQDRIVILIVGKDYNHDSKGMPYTKDARSDTIMLLSADLDAKKLSALSIPRDTKILAPDGHYRKINSTFQFGGVQGLIQTLHKEFGVTVDHYVVLKDTAVEKIVDSVGGVDVEAIDDMFYQDSWAKLNIDIPKGKHHLDGSEAVGFVRFRKMGTHRVDEKGRKIPIRRKPSLEEGDIRRTERQQQLLRSLVAEAMSARNIIKADRIVDIGFGQIDSDLTRAQVLALATIFKSQSTSGMASASLPGSDAMEDGIYFYVPDNERARLSIRWTMYGDEAAGKALVRVSVVNASGVNGAARKVAEELSEEGFTASSGGTAGKVADHTEVIFRKASAEAAAREIARKIGATDVHKDDGDPRAEWKPEVRIILARDVAKGYVEQPKKPAARVSG